jgi:tetratricopeptide (TPR) repeat protein
VSTPTIPSEARPGDVAYWFRTASATSSSGESWLSWLRVWITHVFRAIYRLLTRQLEIIPGFNVRRIRRLMSEGRYEEVVAFGQRLHQGLFGSSEADQPYKRVLRAEFDLHYALALIYTGAVLEGIELLKAIIAEMEGERKPEYVAMQDNPRARKGRRRNFILGRAHNNMGYAYWMEQGHYRLALREFRAALPYFHASELWEEIANTNDNMGRVYTMLGQRDQAEHLIERGLELRRRLKLDCRIALSLNSRAVAYLNFGEPRQAHRLSIEALSIFERLCAKRGVGLACITLGRSLRQLGALTQYYSYEECVAFLSLAAMHLSRATVIFERSVCEPVRLIEAYNELGCTYRDWATLARRTVVQPVSGVRVENNPAL